MDFLSDTPALLAAAVFFARVLDVSLGTVRTILVFRGYRVPAMALGFLESIIWVLAAGAVLRDLSVWYVAVAYAGGYATGNYVGMWLESKLAMGSELVRAISTSPDIELAKRLREDNFSVTELDGHDDHGRPVEVLLVVEGRRRLPRLIDVIERTDPDAIYTTSDVKTHRTAAKPGLKARRMFRLRK